MYSEWHYKTRAALSWLQVLPVNGFVLCKIQYSLPTRCRMFYLLLYYCCDMFRPQLLAIFRELERLSTCTGYVSTYVAEILGWTPSVLSWIVIIFLSQCRKILWKYLKLAARLLMESSLLLRCKSYISWLQYLYLLLTASMNNQINIFVTVEMFCRMDLLRSHSCGVCGHAVW